MTESTERIEHIDPKRLKPDPENPRPIEENGADFQALVASLSKGGVEVLKLLDIEEGTLLIIDGHRRHAAALAAGVKKVPVRYWPPGASSHERRLRRIRIDAQQCSWPAAVRRKEWSRAFEDWRAEQNGLPVTRAPSQRRFAEEQGIPWATFQRMMAVERGELELKEAADAGLLPLKAAAQVASTAPEVQRRFLADVRKRPPRGRLTRAEASARLRAIEAKYAHGAGEFDLEGARFVELCRLPEKWSPDLAEAMQLLGQIRDPKRRATVAVAFRPFAAQLVEFIERAGARSPGDAVQPQPQVADAAEVGS